MPHQLPSYALRLNALHQALFADFKLIVGGVPLSKEHTVVDVGCGDGFFTSLLAESDAHVIGLDNSDAFLHQANLSYGDRTNIEFRSGDVRRMPFDDASLDAIWSAHSMHSYPDIAHCLQEFRRVLRPGGIVAILESDNVHSVMMSWPPDLELAIRQAEHREIDDEDAYIGTYFPRFAMQILAEHRFGGFEQDYYFIRRVGPAGDSLTDFVTLYLQNLLERTSDHLTPKMRSKLALLMDSTSDRYLPRQKSFFFGSLQVLTLARMPHNLDSSG